MKCPRCSAANPATSRWCSQCFFVLAPTPAVAPVPAPPSTVPWPVGAHLPARSFPLPLAQVRKPPRRRPAHLLIAALAVLQVLATAVAVVRLRPDPERGHDVVVPAGDPRAAIDSAVGSVVTVGGYGCGGAQAGTGFVVGDDLVATNAHVVAGLAVPEVHPFSARHEPATLIAFDPAADLALLSVPSLAEPPIALSAQGAKKGQAVAAAGFGGGPSLSTRGGEVQYRGTVTTTDIFHRDLGSRDIVEVSISSQSGDSGSPVVDGSGEVVAVLFGGSLTKPGHTYATDVSSLRRLIELPLIGQGSLECAAANSEIFGHS